MYDFLDSVVEYRTLLARHDAGPSPLSSRARARLTALRRALELDPVGLAAPRRRHARVAASLPAVADVNGEAIPARIVSLGAGGLALHPGPAVRSGDVVVVTLTDEERRRCYQLPGLTVWSAPGVEGPTCGLRFVDVPRRRPLAPRTGVPLVDHAVAPATRVAAPARLRAGEMCVAGVIDRFRSRALPDRRRPGADDLPCTVRLLFTAGLSLEAGERCLLDLGRAEPWGPMIVEGRRGPRGGTFSLVLRYETVQGVARQLLGALRPPRRTRPAPRTSARTPRASAPDARVPRPRTSQPDGS